MSDLLGLNHRSNRARTHTGCRPGISQVASRGGSPRRPTGRAPPKRKASWRARDVVQRLWGMPRAHHLGAGHRTGRDPQVTALQAAPGALAPGATARAECPATSPWAYLAAKESPCLRRCFAPPNVAVPARAASGRTAASAAPTPPWAAAGSRAAARPWAAARAHAVAQPPRAGSSRLRPAWTSRGGQPIASRSASRIPLYGVPFRRARAQGAGHRASPWPRSPHAPDEVRTSDPPRPRGRGQGRTRRAG